ncbi:hypothetical protein BX286_6385 [Streptomyces sp. 3211.6]|uniref:hypothetical protein n=1 Tax=Streptomyces sp. 3211.6 TaxID=1938845 RepID=UPI000EB0944D|nr:hypothetical protein [Streptomyces sp. 3211.6]RKT08293.1 hypothetical protein BX286_6385 [Streptomyces sp. 3211.6]
MDPSVRWLWDACDVVGTFALYRLAISPAMKWGAYALGSGRFPATGSNGLYPDAAVPGRGAVHTALVFLPLTAIALVLGRTPDAPASWVSTAALAAVLWKCLTFDYDVSRGLSWQRVDRLVIAATGGAALVWPQCGMLALILLCGRLGAWTHHSKAAIRILKMTFAWSVTAGVHEHLAPRSAPETGSVLLVLVVAVFLSHYVVACVSKLRLGPRPWDWVTKNRTDHLVASAYSWGWARFLTERQVRRILRPLATVAVWMNAGTIVAEGLGFTAFLSRGLTVAAISIAVVFSLVVFITSGIFFWENIAVGIALIMALSAAPAPVFGVESWLITMAVLLAVLSGLAWRPSKLGWWDTPFVARVYWTGRTSTGEVFRIHNGFMSPFDREFSRMRGYALTDEEFVTFPLGGVEDAHVRDRLNALRLEGEDLAEIKREYGRVYRDDEDRALHVSYLRELFARLNEGVPKSPLPRSLRWLKAPGGHLYYWGDLPAYRLDRGPLEAVQIRYQEVYYQSGRQTWVRLRDELILDVPV